MSVGKKPCELLLALLVTLWILSGCGEQGPAPAPTTVLQGYTSAVATAEAKNDTRSLAITYYERANYLFDQGNYESAIADYTQVVTLDAENARAYNNRGLAYAALKRTDEAIADYGRAIERDRNYVRAYKNRVLLLEEKGALRELAADYDTLATLEPQGAALYRYRQGAALRGLGDSAGAKRAFSAAIDADPKQVDALYERGILNFAEGQLVDALDDFNRAARLSPRAANLLYARGLVYNALGMTNEAIADFNTAIGLQPNDPAALLARAAIHVARNEREEARADLARAQTLPLDDSLTAAAQALELQVR